MKLFALVYVVVLVAVGFVTFVVYGYDKRQARRGGRRVPERTLHLLSISGGWPGAMMGQRVFRHKTQKLTFRVGFWLVMVLHLGLVTGLGYLTLQWSR